MIHSPFDNQQLKFQRAFYGNGTIMEKCVAAYEYAIACEQMDAHDAADLFRRIGDYYFYTLLKVTPNKYPLDSMGVNHL